VYKVGFIIGNGESRQDFDLERLRGKGTIMGCNALYRDFIPDVLMAVDQRMIVEIARSEYAKNNYFVIPSNRIGRTKSTYKVYGAVMKEFNTCGGAVMHLAGMMKLDLVYLLGIDCYGGNVYYGTEGYQRNLKDDRYNTFVRYFEKAFVRYPNTKYINLTKDGQDGITRRFKHKPLNYDTLDLDEFINNLDRFPHQEPIYYHDEYRKTKTT